MKKAVVIDENLPRAFGEVFAKHGFKVLDVRDHGLRGAPDSAVFIFTTEHGAALATSDVDFAQRIHLTEAKHHGIFLLRLPSFLSVPRRCQEIAAAMKKLDVDSLPGCIAVIAPGVLRIHRRVRE